MLSNQNEIMRSWDLSEKDGIKTNHLQWHCVGTFHSFSKTQKNPHNEQERRNLSMWIYENVK